MFMTSNSLTDRSTYVVHSYVYVDFEVVDPCLWVVNDGYDI